MLGDHGQGSEVARFLQQLTEEEQAFKQGLTGLCSGTARHEFITTRLVQEHARLTQLFGSERATALISEAFEQSL